MLEILIWKKYMNTFRSVVVTVFCLGIGYIFSENFFDLYLSDPITVFDVGAHEGNKTDYFLDLGAEHVLCIECQPKQIELLNSKYEKEPRVRIIPYALSDEEGTLLLNICESATTISTVSKHWMTGRFKNYSWNSVVSVKATTLDALIRKFGMPDYCKIDVEGHELSVLKGLTKPIPLISFEFTKEFFEESINCLEYLRSLGYQKFNLIHGEEKEFMFEDWQDLKTIVNHVSNSQDELYWGDVYAWLPIKEF